MVCACAHVCVWCVCVCAYVRACVRACVRVCVCVVHSILSPLFNARRMEPAPGPPRPPAPMAAPMNRVFIRPRPVLNFQIDGYRLCLHASKGRHCQFGDACTFAHSAEELDAWNQELRVARQR